LSELLFREVSFIRKNGWHFVRPWFATVALGLPPGYHAAMSFLADELSPITFWSVAVGLFVLWAFLIRHFHYPPRKK
jgi:hypothetical protein